MRLTLRNLLAYLNDELSPAQTRELGPKVAASEVALQLIEKLRTLTRRRRLSAPDLNLDQEGSPQEPNYVGAYLDCELTEEEQGIFEKLCLENDVYLAEVAACVQLKTLGSDAAIKIPPTARQRMYALVKSREAIHGKPIPASAGARLSTLPEPDGAAEDEEEALLLLDPLYQKLQPRLSGRLVPIAATVLALALVALLFWLLQSRPEPTMLAGPAIEATVPAAKPEAPKPPGQAVELAQAQEVLAEALRPEAWVGRLTGLIVARPALPPNLLLALGQDVVPEATTSDAPPPVPLEPAPVVDQPKPPAEKPASPEPLPVIKVAVGQYESDPSKDGLLFRLNQPGDWRMVRQQAPVLTGERLLALPATRAEISLANRLRLTLAGNLPPDAAGKEKEISPPVEASVMLLQNPDVDLDLMVERGRIALARKGEGQAKLQLRYQDAVWSIVLESPDVEFGIEAISRQPTGSSDGVPHARITLAVQKGLLAIESNGERVTLAERQGFSWSKRSTQPTAKSLGDVRDVTLAWLAKRPALSNDQKDAVSSFQKRLADKLAQNGATVAWLKVACDEALLSKRPGEQYLALYTLTACDQLGSVLSALDDAERPLVRRAALDCLQHFRGRQAGQDDVLRAALLDRGYRPADAEIMLALLRGADQATQATIESLLENLQHFRLPIRMLAWQNLQQLVPIDRLTFDPTAHIEQRERTLEALKKKLLP